MKHNIYFSGYLIEQSIGREESSDSENSDIAYHGVLS